MPFYASHAPRTDKLSGSFLTPLGTPICRETDGGPASHAKTLPPFHGPVFAAIFSGLSPAVTPRRSNCAAEEARK